MPTDTTTEPPVGTKPNGDELAKLWADDFYYNRFAEWSRRPFRNALASPNHTQATDTKTTVTP